MKAAFLTGVGALAIGEVPSPAIGGGGQVLLRVDVVGVCGSDMHYYREGRIGSQIVQYPWIVGHEVGATVEDTDADAHGLRKGQVVAVDPLVACGQCDQCLAGRKHTCRDQKFLGSPGQLPGAMVEWLAMPVECCYPVPGGMTAVQAALTEPLAIGLHARNLAVLPECAQVAILGSGPIGLCTLAAIQADQPCEAYVTDLLDNRLELATGLGAHWTGNAAAGDMTAEMLDMAPTGMDCVFECAGKQETIDQAVRLLRPGGALVLVGIPAEDRITLDFNDLRRKELRVLCVRRQNECVLEAIELLGTGRLDLGPLVTHHFPLARCREAFDTVANYRDGVVKAMITIA